MPKSVKSARGATVDFDLMKIKESIASDPAPLDVQARQDHIDQRLRRRLRNMKKTPMSTAAKQKAPTSPGQKPPMDVAPASPDVNEEEVDFIDEVEDTEEKKTTTSSRQRARRKT